MNSFAINGTSNNSALILIPYQEDFSKDALIFRKIDATSYQESYGFTYSFKLSTDNGGLFSKEKFKEEAYPTSMNWEPNYYKLNGKNVVDPSLWENDNLKVEIKLENNDEFNLEEHMKPKSLKSLTPKKRTRDSDV